MKSRGDGYDSYLNMISILELKYHGAPYMYNYVSIEKNFKCREQRSSISLTQKREILSRKIKDQIPN
jgi:hypothetical protein